MAEIILRAFLTVVVTKLSSEILKGLKLTWDAKKELQKLRKTLGTVQKLLQDAEGRQRAGDAVSDWIGQLKDAAYDADDLLDELMNEALQQRGNRGQGWGKVSNFFSIRNPLVASRIKDIRVKFDGIERLGISYGLNVEVANTHLNVIHRDPTTSDVDPSVMYGRFDDRNKIVELLIAPATQQPNPAPATQQPNPAPAPAPAPATQQPNPAPAPAPATQQPNPAPATQQPNPSIVPILGMGGLGKTVLAQLAYNDPRLDGHFYPKCWIHSSYQLDVKTVIQNILEYDTQQTTLNLSNLDVLESRLRQFLAGGKFLIVLDDFWSEDIKKIDKLKNLFRCGAEGSKIIITTRSEKVASLWTNDDPYRLKGLSVKDCWMVFKDQAVGIGLLEDTGLEAIGMEIGKKCKGVPLAAKALGQMLRMNRDENDWSSVSNCELWQIPKERNEIICELWLSYNYLQSHLKLCFSYCSLFSNGHSFDKDDLIQQWMAHGFIQSRETNKQIEDAGNENFTNLVWNSLVEIAKKEYDDDDDDNNSVGCYRMHGLISDLARFVAQDSHLNVKANRSEDIPITTRHLSVDLGTTSIIPELLQRENKSRTLFFWKNVKKIAVVPENIFMVLRCLRVLDLSCIGIKNLPSSIDKLPHLRYLNLSQNDMEKLPETLCNLLLLQTLKLSGCSHLRKLPKSLNKMISLRHLYTDGCNSLSHIPAKIAELSQLQIFSMFVVSEKGGCSIGELKGLNLRGELRIDKLNNLKGATEAKKACLKEKCLLHKLRLSWDDDGAENSAKWAEQVMKGLKPHRTLKRLHIEDYCGVTFARWFMKLSLPNLVEVSLKKCTNCKQLPPLGKLLYLKTLFISKMYVVQYIDGIVAGSLFQSLEKLTLDEMPSLEKWWGDAGAQVELPRLVKLIIKDCPKLTNLPNSPYLERLELFMSNRSIVTSVANFNLLSFLKIDNVSQDLGCLPIGNLPSLHTLVVSNCPKLTLLQLQNLPTLKVVCIASCHELFSIVNLNYLEKLVLSQCEKLTSNCLAEELMQGLVHLKNLCIKGCGQITSLPQGIQHLTALEILEIGFCPNLERLPEWLRQMATLELLFIRGCYKLVSLPEWLRNLASLKCVRIQECPQILPLPRELIHLTTLE